MGGENRGGGTGVLSHSVLQEVSFSPGQWCTVSHVYVRFIALKNEMVHIHVNAALESEILH